MDIQYFLLGYAITNPTYKGGDRIAQQEQQSYFCSLALKLYATYNGTVLRFLMDFLSVRQARDKLYSLIDEVAENHNPVFIAGKRNEAVLIAKADWARFKKPYISITFLGWLNLFRIQHKNRLKTAQNLRT